MNVLIVMILIMSVPRVISLFRRKTAEEKRYFEVTSAQRLIMAILYFGLAAALVAGVRVFRTPDPRTVRRVAHVITAVEAAS